MIEPLLSIVLCSRNGALFLQEQLDSLTAQTWKKFEIIVVDDCSDDDTVAIARRHAETDPRVKVVVNEKPFGLNANFEKGIKLAQGDYILICDQDDIWLPEKLQKMVSLIDGSLLYYHDSLMVDEKGNSLNKKLSDKYQMGKDPSPLSFVTLNCVTGHACMFSKELAKLPIFPFPQHVYYDNWLAFVACTYGRIHYLDECLVKYRIHQTNHAAIIHKPRRLDERMVNICKSELHSFIQATPSDSALRPYLEKLLATYEVQNLGNSIRRSLLFLRHMPMVSLFRKKNWIRRISFCFKLAFKPFPNHMP